MKPTKPGFFWLKLYGKWTPVEVYQLLSWDDKLNIALLGSEEDSDVESTLDSDWGPEIFPPSSLQ